MMKKFVLIVGNTDGIGAKLTERLLEQGLQVIGISKSSSSIDHPNYRHVMQDISASTYRRVLTDTINSLPAIDMCIHCAGVGERLDLKNLAQETKVFEVNLMGAALTTELVVSAMLAKGRGHFIGLSSLADSVVSADAPSYSASKAGISRYWEGLGLALQQTNVKISNIRFGFVDTKMAKSPFKPFMLSVEQAVDLLCDVIERPRIRATKPRSMAVLAWLASLPNRLRLLSQ